MQRSQTSDSHTALRDGSFSPALYYIPEPDQVLPSSFADWLAQPTDTITGGSKQEQGVFVKMMNDCCNQTFVSPPVRPFRL